MEENKKDKQDKQDKKEVTEKKQYKEPSLKKHETLYKPGLGT